MFLFDGGERVGEVIGAQVITLVGARHMSHVRGCTRCELVQFSPDCGVADLTNGSGGSTRTAERAWELNAMKRPTTCYGLSGRGDDGVP